MISHSQGIRGAAVKARPLSALFLSLLISVLIGACGDTTRRTDPVGSAAGRHIAGDYDDDDGLNALGRDDNDNDDSNGPVDKDNDSDSNGKAQYDSDDADVLDFGHAASLPDRRAIGALIESYYTAAAVGDGARACSLLFPQFAKTFPKDLAEGGEPYLHGSRTCAQVASRLFAHNHAQLSAYGTKPDLTNIRLAGGLGLVVLRFKQLPWREVEVKRERSMWKMYVLLDFELP